jgi:uncharacterized protein YqjF (DUF2071 family)
MTSEVLRQIDHRPWPLPERPWVLHQTWRDLLFAHWPVRVPVLRRFVPPGLEIDTFHGRGWVAVVPFRMTGVRPRFVPSVPGLSSFPELNVRTYVRRNGKPGVWFFSLEATNRVAVHVARAVFHLPYFRAKMHCAPHRLGGVEYESRRIHDGAPPAEFEARYAPIGPVQQPGRGSLEHWLTERYCLYAEDGAGRLHRGDVQHAPWPLQRAEAEIRTNTMAAASGIELPDEAPLLHFAERVDVVVWPLAPA